MTTQNPALAVTDPVDGGRVQSGSLAPDVVKERGDTLRSEDARRDRINELGGYQRLFDAIAAAAKPWPSKAAVTGTAISVFAFVDALDGVRTAEWDGSSPPLNIKEEGR